MSRNYLSPYAKPLPQYPSQSEDYLSLEIGGPGQCSTPARTHFNNLNTKGGGGNFYQNTQQRGRGSQQQNHRYSGNWQNNRYNAGGHAGHWQQQTPRSSGGSEWQRRGGGGGNGSAYKQRNSRQTFNSQVNDLSSYVHPSMLEDPWKELLERRDAIKRSEINLSNKPAENVEEYDDEAVVSAEEEINSDDGEKEECAAANESNDIKSP